MKRLYLITGGRSWWFYLGGKAFVTHTIVTLLGLGWAWLQGDWGKGALFLFLWLSALALFVEWLNG